MPRPMLRLTQQARQESVTLNIAGKQAQNRQTQQNDKIMLDRLLRKKRSKAYMDMLHKLDAGGHAHNQSKVDEIIQAIQNEFPEVTLSGLLLGYVSICHLGPPYEVHTLDISGGIIEHYPAGRPLPGGMEKARSIAMRGGYAFIEVYLDCCRAISGDGTVSVISG